MEKLERLSPPGMGFSGIRRWTVGTIVFSMLFSLLFLPEYFSELNELRQKMEYPVYAGISMTPFEDLIRFPMSLFRLAPLVPLIFALLNYSYFHEETKSIYVMKRLKSPWEIHIRCLALPILGSFLVFGTGIVVYFLYQLLYLICTPENLLPVSV